MNCSSSPLVRRLVLGGALLAATLVASLQDPTGVRAAESPPHRALVLAQADDKSAADAARDAAKEATAAAKAAAKEARRQAAGADMDTDTDTDSDSNENRGGRRHGVSIGIGGIDRQYDSFDQFLDRDPALASMVLGIVFIVFLTPILIIALIIWYKMRKNRMQNEMMLKLAERGIVPPGEAMQAIGTGRVESTLGVVAQVAPLVEQARALQRQAAWSDLRKGVLLGAVGLAITFYSMINEGSASWIGLVLLFVGIGYCVLWYFEDQQVTAARAANPVSAPGPGDTRT